MPRADIRLYGILDQDRLAGMDLARLARQSVDGGATILQLRDKHGTTRRMIDSARAILDAVEGRVPL
ncbi:MAG TPA: thiamine phosphate synthase, partial [Rhabdaerophilum sp.]|nr:thiamine phosphate synthase [Rhabdaerophilum sp.]